jgi:hypothetical protein
VRSALRLRPEARERVGRTVDALVSDLVTAWFPALFGNALDKAVLASFAHHGIDWPHVANAVDRDLARGSLTLADAVAERLFPVIVVSPALGPQARPWIAALLAGTVPGSGAYFRWGNRLHLLLHVSGDVSAATLGASLLESARAYGETRIELPVTIRQAQSFERSGQLEVVALERQGLIAALGSLAKVQLNLSNHRAALGLARCALQLSEAREIGFVFNLHDLLWRTHEALGDPRTALEHLAAIVNPLGTDGSLAVRSSAPSEIASRPCPGCLRCLLKRSRFCANGSVQVRRTSSTSATVPCSTWWRPEHRTSRSLAPLEYNRQPCATASMGSTRTLPSARGSN